MKIDVANQSDRIVSGIRLRFKTMIGMASDVTVSGTFLDEGVKQKYSAQLREFRLGRALDPVLPELPPLPPGSVLTLELFDAAYLELDISAPGATSAIVRVVSLDENWLIGLYTNPVKALFPATLLVLLLSAVLTFVSMRRRSRNSPAAQASPRADDNTE